MSSKHFSSNGANVKLVQKRKPLARAIALVLMAGTVAMPLSAWAETILFQDDFESGNLSKWTQAGSANCERSTRKRPCHYLHGS